MSIDGEGDFKSFISTVGIYIGIMVVIIIGMVIIIKQVNSPYNIEIEEPASEYPIRDRGDSEESIESDQILMLTIYVYTKDTYVYKLPVDSILYHRTIRELQ